MRTKWTEDELNFIRNNYNKMLDEELVSHLSPHTFSSVVNKRKRLGLKRTNRRYDFNDVKQTFANTNYILLSNESEYKDSGTNNLRYICPLHKEKGEQTISLCHLLNGRGCAVCGRKRSDIARTTTLSEENIKNDKEMCNKKGFEYIKTEVVEYTPIIYFICPRHKEIGIQTMRRSNMKRENIVGCKYCADTKGYKFSKGEKRIKAFLEDNNISYVTQYTHSECKDQNMLPFDFFLPELNIIIEYDGQHHFYPVTFNGVSEEQAEINHKNTVKHDKIKNRFCIDNNIKLIRIKYTEYKNIEIILNKALNLQK